MLTGCLPRHVIWFDPIKSTVQESWSDINSAQDFSFNRSFLQVLMDYLGNPL